jgi:hypothetical protein
MVETITRSYGPGAVEKVLAVTAPGVVSTLCTVTVAPALENSLRRLVWMLPAP